MPPKVYEKPSLVAERRVEALPGAAWMVLCGNTFSKPSPAAREPLSMGATTLPDPDRRRGRARGRGAAGDRRQA